MTYKLRADMLQRFGHLANRTALMQDFQTAIELGESDTSGRLLRCEGVDPKEQRSFLLAYCYHQLGSLQHRNKDLEAAYQSYSKVHLPPAAWHVFLQPGCGCQVMQVLKDLR
jgi:hypothetical protein